MIVTVAAPEVAEADTEKVRVLVLVVLALPNCAVTPLGSPETSTPQRS